MAIMHFESAGTFSPSITNSLGYTGLIQFGNSSALAIGTTTAKLRVMTAVQQMDYVEKYYKMWFKSLNMIPESFVDTYLITFFPAAVNKGLNFIIQAKNLSASKIAKANPLFDLNKDSVLTVAEVQKVMLNRLPAEWSIEFLKKKELA